MVTERLGCHCQTKSKGRNQKQAGDCVETVHLISRQDFGAVGAEAAFNEVLTANSCRACY